MLIKLLRKALRLLFEPKRRLTPQAVFTAKCVSKEYKHDTVMYTKSRQGKTVCSEINEPVGLLIIAENKKHTRE